MTESKISTISLVTTTYNDTKNLIQTIKSLNKSISMHLIHIIVDAGTINLQDNLQQIKLCDNYQFKLFTVPDIGIYEGMNYGISMVETKYYMILNSGTKLDVFMLEKLVSNREVNFEESSDVVYVGYTKLTGLRGFISKKPSLFRTKDIVKSGWFPWVNHESIIYPSNLKIFHNIEKYRIAADLDFIGNFASQCRVVHLKKVLIEYPKGGFSDNPDNKYYKRREYMLILKKWLRQRHVRGVIIVITRIIKDEILNLLK